MFSQVAPSSMFGTHFGEKEQSTGQFACLRPDITAEFAKLMPIAFSRAGTASLKMRHSGMTAHHG
ncbi:MAG: hypothetical protein A4E65_02495 [Syntrophorhabdus sp. PtaU1.Bin153]|nr:MAG: hypothetical protein A4E65_02495 [Syntrophorhabdus sp. PtaU1.Bin153]